MVATPARAGEVVRNWGVAPSNAGLQTFVWRAEDDNGDELSYDVMYRREGETTWRPLKSGLKDTLFVWDTSSVPNGTYVLRVLASDAKSNPAETALVGDMESSSFEIDTVAPVVTMGAIERMALASSSRVTCEIPTRPSRGLEYSLDAQRWESAFARDGILDGRTESFEIRLDADAAGRTLVVRASDALGKVGTGQVVIAEISGARIAGATTRAAGGRPSTSQVLTIAAGVQRIRRGRTGTVGAGASGAAGTIVGSTRRRLPPRPHHQHRVVMPALHRRAGENPHHVHGDGTPATRDCRLELRSVRLRSAWRGPLRASRASRFATACPGPQDC